MEEQEYNVIAAEEFQEIHTVLNDPVNRYLVSAIEFDPLEELLWVGSQSGHLTSYYGTQLHKYTAFQGHNGDVLQIVADPYGVLSLMSSQVRYTTRQGLKVFAANDEILQDMQTMVYHDESNVLIAGHQEYFCDLDLTTGEIKQRDVKVEPGVVVMKHSSHFLCCGDSKGVVTLRDPESLSPVHTLEAHNGALSDFDVHGNLLVTCGFSTRYGHLAVDRHLMVYDLRTMRAFPPLQVPIEPFMIKFMPTYTTRCMVISQIGQFLICQPRSLIDQPVIYNINMEGALLMDCSVSSSYQSIAFGDTAGCVHLWGDRHIDELVFNGFSQPTLFPDECQQLPQLAIDEWSVPLSSFLLPECNEPLLSDWPEHMCVKADRRTPEIDTDILKNMTIRQSVGYAPNPKKKLRNEVVYKANQRTRLNSRGQPVDSPICKDASETAVPKMYRKVEIKYSKYGIEDFDFFQYNQTNFAGLEIHIPNAYCNSMLQVFYFIEPLRVSMQNHTCEKEFCLACELGYLFKMLDDTEGQTCQASNFLRAFRTLPEAAALGLILSDADESTGQHNLGRLIQSWHRFVLQELHQDTQAEEKKDTEGEFMVVTKSPIKDFFASEFQIINQCKCSNESTRDSTSFLFDLVYPENEKDGSFLSVLQSSITRQQTMQAWCEECQKYQSTFQTKKFKSAPDVLGINCQLEQEKDFNFWRRQLEIATGKRPQKVNHSPPKPCRYGKFCNRPGCRFYHGRAGELGQSSSSTEEGKPWVPLFFWMKLDNDSGELELMPSKDEADKSTPGIWYHLSASIVSITDVNGDNNLVAHINVGPTFHERKEGITRKQWYVFNDFAITPIFETEAVEFNLDWKVPCVLFYSRVDLEARHDLNVYPQMDYRVLTADKSLAQRQSRFSRHFTPLNATELPKEGDIVGIDAEFVTLNQEEAEMRSDGTLSTIKPSQMSVARITVVRGWGPLTGVPFIDDYISTSEQVVDYLTKFSGIKPGDLDANMSSKHLTTLKTTYQKLRYLVENNIIFVGHGLKKDFRVINIVVPRNQVIDTVELFHLPKQRYVSLKFLAWHFLNIKIQAGNHDSAEDAYTALKLYNKYKEMTAKSDAHFEEELQMLYDTGRQLCWQVPD